MSAKRGLFIGFFIGFFMLGMLFLCFKVFMYFGNLNAEVEALKTHARITDITFKRIPNIENFSISAIYKDTILQVTSPAEYITQQSKQPQKPVQQPEPKAKQPEVENIEVPTSE